jgi:hypothetical protein
MTGRYQTLPQLSVNIVDIHVRTFEQMTTSPVVPFPFFDLIVIMSDRGAAARYARKPSVK